MENVYFENRNKIRRVIGQANTKDDVFDIIGNFIKEMNASKAEAYQFKWYYTQIHKSENEWCLDVGSHSEFFYVSANIDMFTEN